MRAAFIRAHGGPEAIEYGELPVPRPGPTDVLVRMEVSEANHVDRFVRSGSYATPTPFPFVIGRDVVGTVVEAGPGAPGFRTGDAVWSNSLGIDGRQGAWSELCVVPGERLYRLPDDVPSEAAAPVLHSAATAHIGLFRRATLRAGDVIFVAGAAGAVGTAVVQLAVAAGARVVASASARDADWCLALGAEAVFDYRRPDLHEAIAAAVPEGLDLWWDCSGRNDLAAALPLLRPGGRVLVMAGMGATPVLPVGELYPRDLGVIGFAISNASAADLADAARAINRLLGRGLLAARVAETLPLSDARRAHELLAAGGLRGRILIRP